MQKKKRYCVMCGKEIKRARFRAPLEHSTCGITCRNTLIARTRKRIYATGAQNPAWRGGITKRQGYIYLLKKDHPRSNKAGYVKRANLVMEKILGRMIEPNEIVHHQDGNRENDNPENLRLMSRGNHQRLEVARSTAKGVFRGCHKHQKRGKGKNGRNHFVK